MSYVWTATWFVQQHWRGNLKENVKLDDQNQLDYVHDKKKPFNKSNEINSLRKRSKSSYRMFIIRYYREH